MEDQLDLLAEEDPELALKLVGFIAAVRAEAFKEASRICIDYRTFYDEPSALAGFLGEYFDALAQEEIAPYETESL